MICSHRSYLTTRYWIVYSQHELHGQYIIIPPGECNNHLRQYGMTSVGSIWIDEFSWSTKLRRQKSVHVDNKMIKSRISDLSAIAVDGRFSLA
ncbi:unnamed protein product [Schistosoma curassoni]|nr:unnamed protein product [Schistosoma curassoni]